MAPQCWSKNAEHSPDAQIRSIRSANARAQQSNPTGSPRRRLTGNDVSFDLPGVATIATRGNNVASSGQSAELVDISEASVTADTIESIHERMRAQQSNLLKRWC